MHFGLRLLSALNAQIKKKKKKEEEDVGDSGSFYSLSDAKFMSTPLTSRGEGRM